MYYQVSRMMYQLFGDKHLLHSCLAFCNPNQLFGQEALSIHGSLALDGAVVQKISKCHFTQRYYKIFDFFVFLWS